MGKTYSFSTKESKKIDSFFKKFCKGSDLEQQNFLELAVLNEIERLEEKEKLIAQLNRRKLVGAIC